MLGQPVYFLTPEVVGVAYDRRSCAQGVTATDLALLRDGDAAQARRSSVNLSSSYGPGAASLSLPDRATIANMAPEYGATMGYLPHRCEMSVNYLQRHGPHRRNEIERLRDLFQSAKACSACQHRRKTALHQGGHSVDLELDIADVAPSVAGPKRPQDRIDVGHLATRFSELFSKPNEADGFNQPADHLRLRPAADRGRPRRRRRGTAAAARRAARAGRDGRQPFHAERRSRRRQIPDVAQGRRDHRQRRACSSPQSPVLHQHEQSELS